MDKRIVLALAGFVVVGGFLALVACRKGDDDPSPPPQELPSVTVEGTAEDAMSSAVAPVAQGRSWSEIDDPTADGWSTEVLHEKVVTKLKKLSEIFSGNAGTPLTPKLVGSLVSEDVSSSVLIPATDERSRDFRDEIFEVERANADYFSSPREPVLRKPEGFARALSELLAVFADRRPERSKFKVYRVQRDGASPQRFSTEQYVALSGSDARDRDAEIEIHATWRITWEAPESPRMREVVLADFELVRRRSRGALLVDCAESVLAVNPSYESQLLRGLNHWLERLQDRRFFALLGTPGIAIADVDADGLDDLYLSQEGGLPNRLFLQNADGSARDVSAKSGVDFLESCRSALLVDLDGDGHRDLAAALLGELVISSGRGDGTFVTRVVLPTSQDTMSLSAADYDRDGRLDLYLCSYKKDDDAHDAGVVSIGADSVFVYHDANNAARNYLFRNEIDRSSDEKTGAATWSFRDVTREVGLDVNNQRFSFAAAWEDFDRDGDLDLYVANDFGRNNLYRCEQRPDGSIRFADIAASANAEDSASGMSVTWSDFNRDGTPDVYVSNMYSAAGNRITTQREFKPGSDTGVKSRLQRFARGNTLLRGRPGDTGPDGASFEDASVAARVTMGRWAWGSNFVDLNGDGWDDLLVANGYITTNDTGDL